jgi:ribosome-associated toxin RatA of RatAB toxin-antitoxin module
VYVLLTRLLLLLVVHQTSASTLSANPVSCVACRSDLDAMRKGYSADDWQALTRGEIVTSETEEPNAGGSAHANIESSAIISYPAAPVWSVLTDVEARPKFIPGMKKVSVVRVDGNRLWVTEHLRFFLCNIRYQVVDVIDPEQGLISWTLDKSVAHDIADTTGSWQIASLPSGRDTLVRYRAWVDTGRPVPRFVKDFLIGWSLPKIAGGLRSEVQRRFHAG